MKYSNTKISVIFFYILEFINNLQPIDDFLWFNFFFSFLFSLVALYYVNKISQNKYSAPVAAVPVKATQGKKKK